MCTSSIICQHATQIFKTSHGHMNVKYTIHTRFSILLNYIRLLKGKGISELNKIHSFVWLYYIYIYIFYITFYLIFNTTGMAHLKIHLLSSSARPNFKDQAVSAWWIHHMCFTHLSTYTTLNVQAGQQPASRAKRIPSMTQRHEIRQFASRSLIATLSSVVTRGVQTRVRAL